MSDDDIDLSDDESSGDDAPSSRRPTSAGTGKGRTANAPRRSASLGRLRPGANQKIQAFMSIYNGSQSNGHAASPPANKDRGLQLSLERTAPSVDLNTVEELKIETQQKSRVIRELQAERIKLKTRISRLEAELIKADNELEQVLTDKASRGGSEAQRSLAEHQLISNLKRRVQALEKNVSVKDEEVAKLKASQRHRRIKQLQESLDTAQAQKRELEQNMADYRVKVQDEFRGEYERLQRENKKLSQQVQALKKPKNGKKVDDDEDGLTQDEKDRLAAERARLLKAQKDYEEAQEKLKAAAETSKNRIKDLLASEEQLREEVQKLKDQLARAKKGGAGGDAADAGDDDFDLDGGGDEAGDDDELDLDADSTKEAKKVSGGKGKKRTTPKEDAELAKQALREKLRSEQAATAIQAAYKGHVSRKTVSQMKNEKAAESKKQFMADYEKIKARLSKSAAASTIQSQGRGLLARTEYKSRRNTAATRIQRIWRGHRARKIYQKLYFQKKLDEKQGKAEQARLADLRKQQELDRLAEEENSKKLAAQRLSQLSHEEQMERSATKIQAVYRGHAVRMRRGKLAEEQERAAIKIQASFRGHVERKSFRQKYPLWPAEKFEMGAGQNSPAKTPKELGYVFEPDEELDYG